MHAVSSQSTAWKQGKIFYHVISARRYSARSNAVNRQLELYLKAVTRFGRRQDAVTSPLVKISSKILHVFFLIFLAISRRFQEFYNAINTLKERNFVWQCLYRTDDSQKKKHPIHWYALKIFLNYEMNHLLRHLIF